MSSHPDESAALGASEEAPIAALYQRLLDSWNRRDAAAYAALFDEEGHVIGFDGTPMTGGVEIEASLRQIFADHVTAAYIGKIRGVRFLSADVA
ncbi:MAG TPA: SgcJ/EcaC family oxidoreductase, partial [Ktedonobacterales bacterium]|nr:SgcJ/EcaC family oxidoreductase [Ktedonobacterales bacterium]